MNNKVHCFLPCRAGSERVINKNIKPFANFRHGLVEIKIKQLLAAQRIDQIILSTDDLQIIDYAKGINSPKLMIHVRPAELASNSTSTDELVKHARSLISEGHILWTHVTSPFVNAEHYDNIINSYFAATKSGYDSLMTVTPFRSFLWNKKDPINYSREKEKWPRTQTITPLYEVNSAAFLASTNVYDVQQDRIGRNVHLYELDKLTSHDIDWPEDFLTAECMVKEGICQL